MQQPTDQVEGKVCDEKNRNECAAFQKQRRQIPPLRGVIRRGLSELNCEYKTRDQAQQRKNFAKKASEKPSQTEESQDAGKNYVDPVHSPEPLRARGETAELAHARRNPSGIIPLYTRLGQSIEPF
jgi:ATPase subunit of ABC transporter with duplicated ATPase domains